MFIRQRHVKARGKTYVYYSIVETTRESGKPRQVTLYNMGPRRTINECITRHQEIADRWARAFAQFHLEDERRELEWHRAKIEWLKDAAIKLNCE